ncbi:Glucan endo-1,3-beta-glucosidase [Quillaja saponaria]|uniref:glucan endo-1,3-beta-D-glucosidase n=1 Tax=Quillaja saponaria TaxID=32244 RepID=A0AAD7LJ89_QUISA|nr:Glucan endo-1,3-beta-glucosidase [Quillaja saponaria]
MQQAVNIGFTSIRVTTAVSMKAIAASYPPSTGVFSGDITDVMKANAGTLLQTVAPLMINAYPYFPYSSNPKDISFEYATFNAQEPVVDGNLRYYSLFDGMVDAFNAALEKIGAGNVPLAISETGWPTAGNDPFTGKDKAQICNRNPIAHVSKQGTPRRPNQLMYTFIFSIFNENQKPSWIEQNWGFSIKIGSLFMIFIEKYSVNNKSILSSHACL